MKATQNVETRMVWGHPWSPFDRVHTTCFSTLIEIMHLSCTIFSTRHYASAVLAVIMCPSVCPSITRPYRIKATKWRPMETMLLESKFGLQVHHSKSQHTDDKLSLKGAWSRHMTHFKFLVTLKYL